MTKTQYDARAEQARLNVDWLIDYRIVGEYCLDAPEWLAQGSAEHNPYWVGPHRERI